MDWKEFFNNDAFATQTNITLENVKPGYAVTKLIITKKHLNAGNITQGGAIFTLADLAMAAAANAHGKLAFSIQSDIRFLEVSHENDTLTATAQEVLLKRKIAHYRVEIKNQSDTLIAVVDGIFHRKD